MAQDNRFAVFGNPVKHSLSPQIHQMFAAQHHLKLDYQKIEADIRLSGNDSSQPSGDDLAKKLEDFFAPPAQAISQGIRGANITIPFKEQAYSLCASMKKDSIEAILDDPLDKHEDHELGQARQNAIISESANTIYRGTFGKKQILLAANTDGIGLLKDISQNLQWDLDNKNILILGAGGAVRGIIAGLINIPTGHKSSIGSITIANRTRDRLERLINHYEAKQNQSQSQNQKAAQDVSIEISALALDQMHDTNKKFDIIINAIPLFGDKTDDDASSKLAQQLASIISTDTCCYDLVYKTDGKTPFVQMSEDYGARQTADGLGMLVEQAALSFRIWFADQYHPKTSAVIRSLRS